MNGPDEKERDEQGKDAFEAALSRAMRRVEIGADLSAKLLTLAAEAEERRAAEGTRLRLAKLNIDGRVLVFPRQRMWMGGAMAAALVMGCFVSVHVHEQHVQERTARVQQQFVTAMRVTYEALAQTRGQLKQAGVQLQPASSQE